VLSETQHAGDKKGDDDRPTKREEADPIELDKPKRSIGFKAAPGPDHLDCCGDHVAKAGERSQASNHKPNGHPARKWPRRLRAAFAHSDGRPDKREKATTIRAAALAAAEAGTAADDEECDSV